MYRHIPQINPLCCGAACMQMVYERFKLSINQETIWQEIQRPHIILGAECCPDKMQKHFHSNGICALCVVRIESLDSLLSLAQRENLSAIINYRNGLINYHFVLFESLTDNGIIVQDPLSNTPDTLIPFECIVEPQVMIIGSSDNTGQCPHCGTHFPTNSTCTLLYAQHLSRCPYCGEELFSINVK